MRRRGNDSTKRTLTTKTKCRSRSRIKLKFQQQRQERGGRMMDFRIGVESSREIETKVEGREDPRGGKKCMLG
jgi:hypothetical protein